MHSSRRPRAGSNRGFRVTLTPSARNLNVLSPIVCALGLADSTMVLQSNPVPALRC